MRKTKRITVFFLTVCIVFACARMCFADTNGLELIAHRGYSDKAPENTVAAVTEAGKNGFCGCEFDIRTTSDNVWVVSHSNSLVGTTDSTRLISASTYNDLKKIKITKGNGIADYPNEKIPTLTEMLDECAKWGLCPVIEIKAGNSTEIASLCSILDAWPRKDTVTVISFNICHLTQVKKSLPYMKCLYLSNAVSDVDIQLCLANHIDGISFNCEVYSPDILSRAQSGGLILNAWTVDDIDTAKELYAHSVKSITTNTLDGNYAAAITSESTAREAIIKGRLVLRLRSFIKTFF